MALKEPQKLRAGIVPLCDAIVDVGAVEAVDENGRVIEVELTYDVVSGMGIGCRRQGDARHAGI